MPKELAKQANLIISRNIKKCRKKAFPGHGGGRRCAAAFGVTPSQWSHWENNRRLPDEYIRSRLAEFFAIPETELLNPSLAADIVAVKDSPPPKNSRRMDAAGAMPATLSEDAMAEFADHIMKFVAPEVSSRLAAQITPAVIDSIIARVAPAIISEVCQKIAGIPPMTAGCDDAGRAKPGAGKSRSAHAAK